MTVTHRINCTKQTIVGRKHDHQWKKRQQQSTQRRGLWAHHDSRLKELHGCKHAIQWHCIVGWRRDWTPNVSSTLNFAWLRCSFGESCNFDRNKGLAFSGKCGHKCEFESLTLFFHSRKDGFCVLFIRNCSYANKVFVGHWEAKLWKNTLWNYQKVQVISNYIEVVS